MNNVLNLCINDSKNYTYEQYGLINSYLNRLFIYENDNKETIKNIDLSKFNIESKVIFYCVLNEKGILEDKIKQYPNLKELLYVKPLKNSIKLTDNPFNIFKEYKNMNVLY